MLQQFDNIRMFPGACKCLTGKMV